MVVWGIIGVGRAGRARAAAIKADPRADIVLGFRGNPAGCGLVDAGSVEALLARVDAVAICSPDNTHPDLVRAGLAAGCHVLCEFPLAETADEATQLLQLADEAGLQLHVEHIELLGSTTHWWRYQSMSTLSGGLVSFTSSRTSVSVVAGSLARLHRILDILGEPDALRVDVRTHTDTQAILRWGAVEVALDFRAGAGLSRRTRIVLNTRRGALMQDNRSIFIDGDEIILPPGPLLFAADQRSATATILDGAAPYLSRHRLLCALSLRDALGSVTLGSWQSFSPPG